MLISQLIRKLESIKSEHGDLIVSVSLGNWDWERVDLSEREIEVRDKLSIDTDTTLVKRLLIGN